MLPCDEGGSVHFDLKIILGLRGLNLFLYIETFADIENLVVKQVHETLDCMHVFGERKKAAVEIISAPSDQDLLPIVHKQELVKWVHPTM